LKKYSLNDLCTHAEAKGGKCLSKEYEQSGTKYFWICSKGHAWEAIWNNVRRGSWCKKCSVETLNKKTGSENEDVLLKMRKCAISRRGELLSGIYKNALTKYRWRCELGHEWEATWANVFHLESWCKICAYKNPNKKRCGKQGNIGKRVKFESIVELVQKKGGRVISPMEDYKNNKTKIKYECEKGHIFEAHFNFVQQGGWCRTCRVKVVTIEDLRQLAQKFGGELISEKYKGVMQKHDWKCSSDHVFQKTPNAVKRGEWCTFCGDKISERLCRATFEALFHKPFPTLRPKWLTSGKGRLELDGYNEELRIAFEYQGMQHYQQCYFSKTKDDLKKRQEADKRKKELCRLNNILLLEIPCKIPTLRIESYIKMLCIDNHLIDENHIDYHEPILKRAFSQTDLKRMQRLASLKGGRCISPAYVHAHHPLEWECENGHRWQAKPNSIQQGGWCPECPRTRRLLKRKD